MTKMSVLKRSAHTGGFRGASGICGLSTIAPPPGPRQRNFAGEIPPPLVDSPKCPGCSLVGICLPDETLAVGEAEQESAPQQLELFGAPRKKPVKREVRALMTPRSELRPLYLNSQGVKVGKSGAVLQVKDKDQKVLQEARLGEICQVSLMGNVQISTQAVQAMCEAGVPVCYFSMGGGSTGSRWG